MRPRRRSCCQHQSLPKNASACSLISWRERIGDKSNFLTDSNLARACALRWPSRRCKMPTKPTTASMAAKLTVPERILLFCLASDTDWQAASITHATAQQMMVRGLIERDRGATRCALTEEGRAVLVALLRDPTARSAFGGGLENICSVRGFRSLTLSRHSSNSRVASVAPTTLVHATAWNQPLQISRPYDIPRPGPARANACVGLRAAISA
jgi:hypothetical protein